MRERSLHRDAAVKNIGMAGSQNVCVHCGTPNDVSEQFCENCGYSLAATSNTSTVVANNTPTVMTTGQPRTTGALSTGNLIGGRYRITRLVGQGGFGAVYEASDERFQGKRTVALKEMSDAHLKPAERMQAIQDFRQEATLLVQLTHPNLPDVSDFFEESGKAYLVMGFVQGKTLETIQDETGGPLNEQTVMGWALQLCDVLEYLHTQPQPIVFRDMKPSNVMVTQKNQVKLIDFGIARIFKSTAVKDTTSLGSKGYAPFEQYGKGQSDARSDLYALGATLYDLLTKEVPADAVSRQLNPQAFIPPHQINPRISLATEQIIIKAMQREKKDRYQSAEEMRQAILASHVVPNTGPTVSNSVSGFPLPGGGSAVPVVAMSHAVHPSAPPMVSSTPVSPMGGQQMAQIYAPAPPPGGTNQPKHSRRAILGAGLGLGAVAALGGLAYTFFKPGPPMQINFVFSTEKKDWLANAIESFNQTGKKYQDQRIEIVPTGITGSLDSTDGILNRSLSPLPALWSPASSLELNRLVNAWNQKYPGKPIVSNATDLAPQSLVFTPLVLAIKKQSVDVVKRYGDLTGFTWRDLLTAIQKDNLKFGHTSPKLSNSGLLTITALAYDYAKKTSGLKNEDVQNKGFLDFLDIFESQVSEFGRSSQPFLEQCVIPRAGYDVVTTYESLVLAQPNQPFLLAYPSSSVDCDNPIVILQGDWVKSAEQNAAKQFQQFLLAEEQQKLALKYGFRPVNPQLLTADTPDSLFKKYLADPASINFQVNPPNNLVRKVNPPSGDVVDTLLSKWSEKYGTYQIASC